MPTYKNRDGADVTAAQLSDEDLLNLTTHNRDKALAELAAKGHHLAAVIIDVGAPCPNELCMGGRVRVSGDVVIDCPDCDGAGTIDARPVCTDPGCIERGHHYQATGYECARVHAHGARPLPLDVEPPGYRGPAQDADPYPWDEPTTRGAIVAPAIEGELKATALVSDLNAKLAALGVNARAELTPGAITITIPGDTSLADVEAIAELLGQAVSSWPGRRPRVTGRVETEARFVTPADLAAVVAMPESAAALYREACEEVGAEIAKLILGPTSIPGVPDVEKIRELKERFTDGRASAVELRDKPGHATPGWTGEGWTADEDE